LSPTVDFSIPLKQNETIIPRNFCAHLSSRYTRSLFLLVPTWVLTQSIIKKMQKSDLLKNYVLLYIKTSSFRSNYFRQLSHQIALKLSKEVIKLKFSIRKRTKYSKKYLFTPSANYLQLLTNIRKAKIFNQIDTNVMVKKRRRFVFLGLFKNSFAINLQNAYGILPSTLLLLKNNYKTLLKSNLSFVVKYYLKKIKYYLTYEYTRPLK